MKKKHQYLSHLQDGEISSAKYLKPVVNNEILNGNYADYSIKSVQSENHSAQIFQNQDKSNLHI